MVDWDVRLLEHERDAGLVVLTGVDVTERIAGQERLQETEAFQRQVLDRLPAIVWTTDRELRTTFSAGGGLAQLGLRVGRGLADGNAGLQPTSRPTTPITPRIAAHIRALKGESSPWS